MRSPKTPLILGPDGNPIRPEPDQVRLQSTYTVSAFDPPYVSFEPTTAENIISRDLRHQHSVWRSIYNYDNVAGVAIELYGALPFGDFSLSGIDDPEILKVYEESLENLNLENYLSLMATEFMSMGKLCVHFTFNQSKGIWADMIIHDPDFIQVEPVPLINTSPLVSLLPNPAHKQFAKTAISDPRFSMLKSKISGDLLQKMLRGQTIPLAASNTLYMARKTSPQDYLGTSIYTRILNMVLYERALINGNIEAINRRIGPVRIISPTNADALPPELGELNDYVSALVQADRDKVQSYLATRRPINIDTIAPNEFIKFTDEWQIIQDTKLRAMGMSDTMLTGEANFSSLETVLSVFLERVKALRAYVEQKMFYEKLFVSLARVHNFVKRTKADLDHNVRTSVKTKPKRLTSGYRHASDLIMPEIQWANRLQPSLDQNFLMFLESLESKGVPITLRTWASVGSVHIDKEMEGMKEDLRIREEIQEWKNKKAAIEAPPVQPGEEGGDGSTQPSPAGSQDLGFSLKQTGRPRLSFENIAHYPFAYGGKVFGVPIKICREIHDRLKSDRSLMTPKAWEQIGNKYRIDADIVKFVLREMNIPTPPIRPETSVTLLTAAADKLATQKEYWAFYYRVRAAGASTRPAIVQPTRSMPSHLKPIADTDIRANAPLSSTMLIGEGNSSFRSQTDESLPE